MAKQRHRPMSVAEHHEFSDRITAFAREAREIGHIIEERFPSAIVRQWGRAVNPMIDCRELLENDLIRAMQLEGCDDPDRTPCRYVGRQDSHQ